jgi:prophage regulatory protein
MFETPAETTPRLPRKPIVRTTLPEIGYVRLPTLLAILPMSRTTIWRKAKSGEFPKPVKLYDTITAWKVEEVREWMDSRKSAE